MSPLTDGLLSRQRFLHREEVKAAIARRPSPARAMRNRAYLNYIRRLQSGYQAVSTCYAWPRCRAEGEGERARDIMAAWTKARFCSESRMA